MSDVIERSLFERIGGADAVTEAVHKLYLQITVDPILSPFFSSDRLHMIKHHQRALFTMAFGGPDHYSGRTLRSAHAHLVADGLTDLHFDAVVYYLVETLKEMRVSPELIEEVRSVIEPFRDDVLGR